uniref:Uncharacterized protein n=1 Tax=Romanomermis culicivorax TaxID=13658 RepID=A0A915HV17_ROMCU
EHSTVSFAQTIFDDSIVDFYYFPVYKRIIKPEYRSEKKVGIRGHLAYGFSQERHKHRKKYMPNCCAVDVSGTVDLLGWSTLGRSTYWESLPSCTQSS